MISSALGPAARRRLLHVVVTLVVFAGCLLQLRSAAARTPFHGDESMWIASTRFFSRLFVEANPRHRDWQQRYETLTQPAGFSHLLGLGLWLQGRDPHTTNGSYNWRQDLETNRRWGNVPATALLAAARRVSVLIGAGALALLYVIGVELGAPLAGAAAVVLAAASPHVQQYLCRAMADGATAFFVLLALAACLAAARGRPRYGVGEGVTVGVAIGIGLSVKLTAILALPALGLTCILAWLRRRQIRPIVWGAGSLALATILATAVDPFLWPDPLARGLVRLGWRAHEMSVQQGEYPAKAVREPWRRPGLVVSHAVWDLTWAYSALGIPLDVAVAPIGLVALGGRAVRSWRRRRRLRPALLFVLWAGIITAGITAGYRLDSPRYTLLPLLFTALCSGIGGEILVRELARRPRSA